MWPQRTRQMTCPHFFIWTPQRAQISTSLGRWNMQLNWLVGASILFIELDLGQSQWQCVCLCVLVCRRCTPGLWDSCQTWCLMTHGVTSLCPLWHQGNTLRYRASKNISYTCIIPQVGNNNDCQVAFFLLVHQIRPLCCPEMYHVCFRCHPSECRVYCCSSSPNCSTFPLSETFGPRSHAQACSITGWDTWIHHCANTSRFKIFFILKFLIFRHNQSDIV